MPLIFAFQGVWIVTVSTAPGSSGLSSDPWLVATAAWLLSNHVSEIESRAIGAVDVFLTLIVVVTMSPLRLVTGCRKSTSAWPLIGGSTFLPARIGFISGAFCASRDAPATLTPTSAAITAMRVRIMGILRLR